jgi:hypothetical protein
MGTRSLTFVYTDHYGSDESPTPIINMYRQFDGYPTGHGAELATFLNSFDAITNGIPFGDTRKLANGMGCLAAQLIAHFKQSVGGFYIYPVTSKDCGQEYEYHIYSDRITVFGWDKEHLFTGPWSAFTEFCTGKEDA